MRRSLLLCFTTITLLTITPIDSVAHAVDGPGPHVCGGVAGVSCPDGYFCEYPEPRYPDAQGICRLQSGSVTLEQDTDRPGSDYWNFDLSQAAPERCRNVCAGAPRCKAFTYVKPGVQGTNARCWLKDSVPQAGPSSCCISGVKAGMPPPPPLGPANPGNE